MDPKGKNSSKERSKESDELMHRTCRNCTHMKIRMLDHRNAEACDWLNCEVIDETGAVKLAKLSTVNGEPFVTCTKKYWPGIMHASRMFKGRYHGGEIPKNQTESRYHLNRAASDCDDYTDNGPLLCAVGKCFGAPIAFAKDESGRWGTMCRYHLLKQEEHEAEKRLEGIRSAIDV